MLDVASQRVVIERLVDEGVLVVAAPGPDRERAGRAATAGSVGVAGMAEVAGSGAGGTGIGSV